MDTFQLFGFLSGSEGKDSACSAGDPGSSPGSGRCPREGNGKPLQYFCLENPMDRGAWQATVHGIARVGDDLASKPPSQKINDILYKPGQLKGKYDMAFSGSKTYMGPSQD